jgi:hypothetical protein
MKINDLNLIAAITFSNTNLVAIYFWIAQVEFMLAMRKTGQNYWITNESPLI